MKTWTEHCGFTLNNVDYEERSVTFVKNDKSEEMKMSFEYVQDVARITKSTGAWEILHPSPMTDNTVKSVKAEFQPIPPKIIRLDPVNPTDIETINVSELTDDDYIQVNNSKTHVSKKLKVKELVNYILKSQKVKGHGIGENYTQ
jgi:hypothetical protein